MPCTDPRCTDPHCQGSPAQYQIAAVIQKHGQLVMGVLESDLHPAFAHTIGRTERGQPELLVFADTFDQLKGYARMLSYLGPREVKNGQCITLSEDEVFVVENLKKHPELLEIAHDILVVRADRYYDRPADVLYLIRKPLSANLKPAPGLH